MGCDTLTPKDIRLCNIQQTNNPLIARPLSKKSQLFMVMSCACLGAKAFPYSNYLCRASYIAAAGIILIVFRYDAVLGRDSNLSPPRRRADVLLVEPWFWVVRRVTSKFPQIPWRKNGLFSLTNSVTLRPWNALTYRNCITKQR